MLACGWTMVYTPPNPLLIAAIGLGGGAVGAAATWVALKARGAAVRRGATAAVGVLMGVFVAYVSFTQLAYTAVGGFQVIAPSAPAP